MQVNDCKFYIFNRYSMLEFESKCLLVLFNIKIFVFLNPNVLPLMILYQLVFFKLFSNIGRVIIFVGLWIFAILGLLLPLLFLPTRAFHCFLFFFCSFCFLFSFFLLFIFSLDYYISNLCSISRLNVKPLVIWSTFTQ